MKDAYLHFLNVRYQCEVRACQESYAFVPDEMNRETFVKDNELSLANYRALSRVEYRMMVLETKISRTIHQLFGPQEDFFLYLTWEEKTHFNEKEKLLYVNLLPYSIRFETKKREISGEKEILFDLFRFMQEETSLTPIIEKMFEKHAALENEYHAYIELFYEKI